MREWLLLQAVLSRRSSGEAQVTDLRRRAESLCGNSSLDGDRKLEVEQTARDAEERWRLLLGAAEDAHRCCHHLSHHSCPMIWLLPHLIIPRYP